MTERTTMVLFGLSLLVTASTALKGTNPMSYAEGLFDDAVQELDERLDDLDQHFEHSHANRHGQIGAVLRSSRDATVEGVVAGAPAHLVGIESGDLITAVDGVELSDWDRSFMHLFWDEAGTTEVIDVERQHQVLGAASFMRVEMERVQITRDALWTYDLGTQPVVSGRVAGAPDGTTVQLCLDTVVPVVDGHFEARLPAGALRCTARVIREAGTIQVWETAVFFDVHRDAPVSIDLYTDPWRPAGIGIFFDIDEAGVVVRGVTPDSPADEAGLMANDLITAVDGVSAAGWYKHDVPKHLTGPADSVVTVDVWRNGERFRRRLRREIIWASWP